MNGSHGLDTKGRGVHFDLWLIHDANLICCLSAAPDSFAIGSNGVDWLDNHVLQGSNELASPCQTANFRWLGTSEWF